MKARVLILCFCLLCIGRARAGEFEFASVPVAGPPGGRTAPVLVIGFRGDGATTDAQATFAFDGSRFVAQVTSHNGAFCVLPQSGHILVISPSGAFPLSSAFVRYCEVRFDIAPGTPGGSYDIEPEEGSIECFSLVGSEPCAADAASAAIRVGAVTPPAMFDYFPAAGSSVVLADGSAEIGADFIAGGFGASVELHGCALVVGGSPNFGAIAMTPQPFAFASDQTGTGLIGLSCTPQSAAGNAQLDCIETRNGIDVATRSWNLVCPALPPELILRDGFETAP
jgi:hypothetical protein